MSRLNFAANLSLMYTEVPLLERFAAAAATGFARVEIQFPYELSADAICEQLDEHGLELVLFNVPAGDLMSGGDGLACVPGREEAFAEALVQAAEYAELLRPNAINVLAGRQPEGASREACLDTLLANLQRSCEALSPLGIRVTSEAINSHDMPRFLIHSTTQMLELKEKLGHPAFGLQYDLYHMARMGEDLLSDLRTHIGEIAHIQFADSPGRGEPGTGELDFAALFGELETLGYAGTVAAEYKPSKHTAETLDWLLGSAE